MSQADYYTRLGVSPTASDEEVRVAYYRLARVVHPDLHPDQREEYTERMKQLNEAYSVLSDPGQRRDYDARRAASDSDEPRRPHQPPPPPPRPAPPDPLEIAVTEVLFMYQQGDLLGAVEAIEQLWPRHMDSLLCGRARVVLSLQFGLDLAAQGDVAAARRARDIAVETIALFESLQGEVELSGIVEDLSHQIEAQEVELAKAAEAEAQHLEQLAAEAAHQQFWRDVRRVAFVAIWVLASAITFYGAYRVATTDQARVGLGMNGATGSISEAGAVTGVADAPGEAAGETRNELTWPVITSSQLPRYTPEAIRAGIEGQVLMDVVVHADGRPDDIVVVQSLDTVHGLDRAAVAAVRQARFTPGRRNGAPLATRVQVSIGFSLAEVEHDVGTAVVNTEEDTPAEPAQRHTERWRRVVLPSDTLIPVRLMADVSSHTARVDDTVRAEVAETVQVRGGVVAAGTPLSGRVALVDVGATGRERHRLAIVLDSLHRPGGTEVELPTETLYLTGEPPRARKAKVGGAAVAGAIIGALLGGGRGAVSGGAAGAAAMEGAQAPAALSAGDVVDLRVTQSVVLDVTRSDLH